MINNILKIVNNIYTYDRYNYKNLINYLIKQKIINERDIFNFLLNHKELNISIIDDFLFNNLLKLLGNNIENSIILYRKTINKDINDFDINNNKIHKVFIWQDENFNDIFYILDSLRKIEDKDQKFILNKAPYIVIKKDLIYHIKINYLDNELKTGTYKFYLNENISS